MRVSSFLFLLFFLSVISCKKEECNDGLIDLAAAIKITTTITILNGMPLEIPFEIKSWGNNCDGKRMMPPTAAQITVYHTTDDGATWNVAHKLLLDIPGFPVGETFEDSFFITFDAPGSYKYEICADVTDVVMERNESNCQ